MAADEPTDLPLEQSNVRPISSSLDETMRATTTVNPKELYNVQTNALQDSYSNPPIVQVAQPHDWTKNLIHLAKTSELKSV
jgi:hypothetical protein